MRGDQHNPASSSEHLQRMFQDWYYAPKGPPPGGADAWRPLPDEIIRVKLTADWPSGDGAAVQVELDTSGAPSPTTRAVTLRDPLNQVTPASNGDYFWVKATYDGPGGADGQGGYYEPLVGGGAAGPVAFELYDDFTPGSVDKYVWTLNSDYSRNTGAGHATVKVSDEVLKNVRAYGSNHTGFSSARGALGFYIVGTDTSHPNQILNIQRLAKAIKVTAPSNVAANATFTVTSCTVLDDGQDPCGGSDGASITITNWPQQLCSGSVAKCYANGSGGWDVWDGDCAPSGGCT